MSLARNVATVGTATLLSRLLGFLRDVGIAAVLGAGVLSDAFFAALQIPNLFRRLLAEGALNSAFVPMWLRIRDDSGATAARRFGEETLAIMLLALGLIALACVVFAPIVIHLLAPGFHADSDRFLLAVEYLRLSVPYIAIAGLVAVVASILNAEGRVAAAAFGVMIFNVIMIAAVVFVLRLDATPITGAILSLSIVVAGLAQLAVVGIAAARLPNVPLRLAVPGPDTRRFFMQVAPGVIAGGVPQLTLMAGAIVASSSPAAVSWLYYANRLYELPLGVVSVAIASVLGPAIAASLRGKLQDGFAAAQSRALEIGIGLALPAAAAFAALATPMAGALFERGAFGPSDTHAVAGALAAISAGLPGHVLEKVFGAVSFAHEDTRTPMSAALAGLAVATAGALALFPHYGHVGIAAAIAMSGWVGATILGLVLARRRWLSVDGDAGRRLPRIVVATVVMATAIIGGEMLMMSAFNPSATQLGRIAMLALLVALGLAVYLASLQALGVARIRELAAAVRHKL